MRVILYTEDSECLSTCEEILKNQTYGGEMIWLVKNPNIRKNIQVSKIHTFTINNKAELISMVGEMGLEKIPVLIIDSCTWYPNNYVEKLYNLVKKYDMNVYGKLYRYDVYNQIYYNEKPPKKLLNKLVKAYTNHKEFLNQNKRSIECVTIEPAVNMVGLSRLNNTDLKNVDYMPDIDKRDHRLKVAESWVGDSIYKYFEIALRNIEVTWRYLELIQGGKRSKRMVVQGLARQWAKRLKTTKNKVSPESKMEINFFDKDKVKEILNYCTDNHELTFWTDEPPRIEGGAAVVLDFGDGRLVVVDGRRRLNKFLRDFKQKKGVKYPFIIVEVLEG